VEGKMIFGRSGHYSRLKSLHLHIWFLHLHICFLHSIKMCTSENVFQKRLGWGVWNALWKNIFY